MAPPDPKTTNELADLFAPWIERLRTRKKDGTALTGSDRKAQALEEQLKNLSLGAPDNSAPPESVSISIGRANIPEAEMELFGNSIGFLSEALGTDRLDDIEDLDDAREALVELSNKTKAVKEYKQRRPDFKRYQVVSFSRLTAKHLSDMGVTSKRLSKDHQNAILGVMNDITPEFNITPARRNHDRLSVIFDRFWKELMADGRYIKDFKVLKKSIGRKPEARARMLTDYILGQLMVFVEEKLDLVQLMFLELVLASSHAPVAIMHRTTATLLTGSVDYAIMSSLGTKQAVARSLSIKSDDLGTAIGGMSNENNFDDLMRSKFWKILKGFKHFKFTLIEEKRKDLVRKELKDCEPQVTGEALVLQSKAGQDWTSWCLSNGEDWIFGVLRGKDSRSFPPVSIDDENLEENIKKILKMLVLWTVCEAESLNDHLEL